MSPTNLSQASHLAALKTRHHHLATAVERELQRPHPDQAELSRLKRQKLQLKDQIQVLEGGTAVH